MNIQNCLFLSYCNTDMYPPPNIKTTDTSQKIS